MLKHVVSLEIDEGQQNIWKTLIKCILYIFIEVTLKISLASF